MNEYIDGLVNYMKQFKGMTVKELFSRYGISTTAKSKNYLLTMALMAGYEGKDVLELNLRYYHVYVKTVQLNEKGHPNEGMSFPAINFEEMAVETWETSEVRKTLLRPFIIVVYREHGNDVIFDNIFSWKIPLVDLDGEIRWVWEDTKEKVLNGTAMAKTSDGKFVTTFAKEKDTHICHIRPHGRNSLDPSKIPTYDKVTGYSYIPKHSFWFNHSYIMEIIEQNKEI